MLNAFADHRTINRKILPLKIADGVSFSMRQSIHRSPYLGHLLQFIVSQTRLASYMLYFCTQPVHWLQKVCDTSGLYVDGRIYGPAA
jgi:hypothetical protein